MLSKGGQKANVRQRKDRRDVNPLNKGIFWIFSAHHHDLISIERPCCCAFVAFFYFLLMFHLISFTFSTQILKVVWQSNRQPSDHKPPPPTSRWPLVFTVSPWMIDSRWNQISANIDYWHTPLLILQRDFIPEILYSVFILVPLQGRVYRVCLEPRFINDWRHAENILSAIKFAKGKVPWMPIGTK